MTQLTLTVPNGSRAVVYTVARNPRTIADAIRKFARARGVSPLSVDYRVA